MTFPKYLKNSLFEELGVQTIVNAGGTKSAFGGSRMHPQVIEAISEASRSFVNVAKLNRKIGEYIATITGAEAGMVTSGAASGVVLSMAACMTGNNPAKARKLPDSSGMKNGVIIQKIHRGSYSHMYTFPGATFVEVGNFNECLAEELEEAISENTAAIAYLFGPRVSTAGLSLKEVVCIAKNYKVPVIVDAAAMLPPKSNLRRFIGEGADLVTFSGGKLIHGPQATGLLFGKKELIEAAYANAYPNHSIGRPHKVSKEDMVGLYVALKLYIESDEEKMVEGFKNKLIPIYNALQGIKGLNLSILNDGVNYHVPVAVISFNAAWQGPTIGELTKLFIQNNPPIYMQAFKELGHLVINPISLQEDEPEFIASVLKKELGKYDK